MRNNFGRRQRERLETRLKILDAARELFAVGGEECLTLRRVAERIEYSATTIYLHFRNKEALVRELCAADFAAFSRRLVQADRLADPLDRLKKVSVGYIDFGLQYPGQYRAMFINGLAAVSSPASSSVKKSGTRNTASDGSNRLQPDTEESTKNGPDPHDFLQSAVFKALAAGIFKPEYRDVPLMTQTLWAGLHGLVSLHQTRAKHSEVAWRPIQVLTETMIECLLNGMLVPSLAATPAWRRPA